MPYNVKSAMSDMPAERTVDERTLPPPPGDLPDMGDYSEDLKIWLPVAVDDAAALLAEQYMHSKVLIVRNALIIHVYGRLAFDQLVLHGHLRAPRGYVDRVVNPKQLYVSERESHEAGQQSDMARLDPVAHQELLASGQPATIAMRVEVPPGLKEHLQLLAGRAGKELSEYCREVLTAYYLGALGTSGS